MIGATWRGTLAVVQFEAQRSRSLGRWALWLVLASFPVAIVSIVRAMAGDLDPQTEEGAWAVLIFALTQVVSVLGVLLWASPALQVELENRTWVFSATRPYGRRCLLLGRYVVAVLWSASAGCASVLVCCVIAQPAPFLTTLAALLALTVLSCAAFAALYIMFAVLFPKRAMTVAFTFTLFFELMIAFVPAMINQVTIQFRLRCLLVRWLGLQDQFQQAAPMFFSDASSLHHLVMLAVYAAVLLIVAVVMLEQKELPAADD